MSWLEIDRVRSRLQTTSDCDQTKGCDLSPVLSATKHENIEQ